MARKDATTLTDPQKAFCDGYLADPTRHATRAYQAAYPRVKSEGAARTNASRLLANPKVDAYLQAQLDKLHATAEVTQQRIIEALAEIGFAPCGEAFIRVPDKLRALELLGKNLKMFTDKLEHSGEVTTKADWVRELLTAVTPTVGPPGLRR